MPKKRTKAIAKKMFLCQQSTITSDIRHVVTSITVITARPIMKHNQGLVSNCLDDLSKKTKEIKPDQCSQKPIPNVYLNIQNIFYIVKCINLYLVLKFKNILKNYL